jgi:hypothetical protein
MQDNFLSVWKLHDLDVLFALRLAHKRRRVARERGAGDPYWNQEFSSDGLWWEVNSVGAEIAYVRLTGGEKANEDAPWDVMVGTHKVDVKWTPWPNGVLLVKNKTWLNGRPDWFALFTGRMPLFEYKGRIEANILLARRINEDPKFAKPGHTAEQWELQRELLFG